MSTTDFSDDLQELYNLADRLVDDLEASGELLLRTEPTIYASCGRKPVWPFSASWSFDQLWASL